MNQPKLHFSAMYKMAWESFKSNGWTLVGLFVLMAILVSIPAAVGALLTIAVNNAIPIVLGYIASLIVLIFAGTIYSSAIVQLAKGEKVTFGGAMQAWKKTPGFFAVCFLYMIIVLGGTILFVVPGIIWSAQFFLAPMIYLAEDVSVTDALHLSSVRTNGYKFDVLASNALLNQMISYVLMPAYYVVMIIVFFGGLFFSGFNSGSVILGIVATIFFGILAVIFAIFLWVATQIVSIATARTYVELSK